MTKRMERISLISFTVVAGLFGLFYFFADFGKALSQRCGLLQLLGAAVLCVALFGKKGGMPKLCGGVVLAISLGQAVALMNWVVWNGVSPRLFGWYLSPGWFAFFLHAVFAAWGIAICIFLKPFKNA